jgi:predicted GTPase
LICRCRGIVTFVVLALQIVAFTAAQIPGIENKTYPPQLAGDMYPDGIPILSEDNLEEIIQKYKVDRCILAYSDLPHSKVMDLASRVLAGNADFALLSPQLTSIKANKPVIAVTAVRTGCGKSQTSHYVIDCLKKDGLRTVLVRHPMPYGDLASEAVQRFEKYEDLAAAKVTIEEREEYEQHMKKGTIVFAGVDYAKILEEAEKEADVIIWDGGNNDWSFYKPDLWIVVADPHRAGAEVGYYPGDVNFRAADVITINKVNTAPEGSIDIIKKHAQERNPNADIYLTNSIVSVADPDVIKGKKVVTIDDGPTLTHGEMAYGAGGVSCAAALIVSHAVGAAV